MFYQVLDEVKQHNFDTVLTHSLSNTGASVYQQFSQLVISQQPKNIKINGAVFDSGPGTLELKACVNVNIIVYLDIRHHWTSTVTISLLEV